MTELDKEKEEETEITPTEVIDTTDGTKPAAAPRKKQQPTGQNLVNKNVETPYGMGVVLEYRESDSVYAVKLTSDQSYSAMAMLYTKTIPTYIRTLQDDINDLNVAYEALERMRRMNLEMECFEAGVAEVKYDCCTTCLLQSKTLEQQQSNHFPRLQNFVDKSQKFVDKSQKFVEESTKDKKFPKFKNLWGKVVATTTIPSSSARKTARANTNAKNATANSNSDQEQKEEEQSKSSRKLVLPRIQKFLDEKIRASASPCLICASMSCSEHSSAGFKKEGITLCLSCERLFELNFIVDCVSTPNAAERAKHIDHMIDRYDRCLLLLKYSTQYVEQIALSLEQQKEQANKVGLGSSSVGVLSGVLGIAAAATILTPAGPPLLIASLFFGGSATAVQTGTEAFNYFSEPNKLADRIIALHGMILSILRVTSTLRDAMLRDHIRTDVFEAESKPLTEQMQSQIEKNRISITAGANAGRSLALGGAATMEAAGAGAVVGVAGIEAGATAGASAAAAGARGATALSRAGTAAARTLRFARFAGGALSAAVLVLEANSIQSTLKDIQQGNPCHKADQIRKIGKEISEQQIPSTSALDEECQAYLQALASRPTPPLEVSAMVAEESVAADRFPQAECQIAPTTAAADLVGAGVVIVDGDEPEAEPVPESQTATSGSLGLSLVSASSLLQRIQRHQERRQENSSRADEVVPVVSGGDQARSSEVSLVL